jgi:hypothetical protein
VNKRYLGDSVYVEFDECSMLKLTTEDGIGVSNTIYLEGPVYEALVEYVAALRRPSEEEHGESNS